MGFTINQRRFPNTQLLAVFPKIIDLYLNDDELFIATLAGFPGIFIVDSSLLNCYKLPDVSEKLSLYSIKLYIGIIISKFSVLSTCSSFI